MPLQYLVVPEASKLAIFFFPIPESEFASEYYSPGFALQA